jgi:hypothetical protein
MAHKFILEHCKGVSGVTSDVLAKTVVDLVRDYNEESLGYFWERITLLEYLFEEATEDLRTIYGDDHPPHLWLEMVKWNFAKKLYDAGEEIYLGDRYDLSIIKLDGCCWIFSGGMEEAWGNPTDAVSLIELIRITGLDLALEASLGDEVNDED